MEKNLYIKPEVEVIEMELQSSVMTPSDVDVDIDSSDKIEGSFDSSGNSFWKS